MPNNDDIKQTADRFSYHRSSDGCDDTFLIEDRDGQCILQLHFWDEPDTTEAAMAEAKAQMLVAALNLTGSGWVLPPYPHWTLRHDKQIADIWGIEDVQTLRPKLTADQAWEILQRVDDDHDPNHGITRKTIRRVADELFPESGRRKPKRPRNKKPRTRPRLDPIPF
ncbi:MAG TPA: hypothetical protein VKU01_06830 [Bryobacteraceae bacterium]|nr:hypothetical protein [Bryobacteraceae bacterium]